MTASAQPPERSANPPGGRERPELEQLARVVQRRLQLDDVQAARLREVSARYAGRRQVLVARERDARRALREQLTRGEAADQARVAEAIDALVEAQRRRSVLVADEQRELAAFLTPVQRARFLGLQERAFRAAQRARMEREGRAHSGSAHARPSQHGEPFARRKPRR
jgi:Spy/CpxP family protein refolding chaperone